MYCSSSTSSRNNIIEVEVVVEHQILPKPPSDQVLKTDGSPLAVVGLARGEEGGRGATTELQAPQVD